MSCTWDRRLEQLRVWAAEDEAKAERLHLAGRKGGADPEIQLLLGSAAGKREMANFLYDAYWAGHAAGISDQAALQVGMGRR